MAATNHLQKRGGVWYYYRRVPKHLVPALGKQFIKRSLGTGDLREAKQFRTVCELHADAQFAAAERDVVVGADQAPGSRTSIEMLIEHVRSMVVSMDKRATTDFVSHPPVDNEALRERRIDAEYELGILTNPADPRQDELVGIRAQRLLDALGLEISDRPIAAEFDEVVRRALIELCRRKLDRYENNFQHLYHDNLFAPDRRSAIALRELADVYLGEKEEEYRLNGVSVKRMDKLRASVATMCELLDDTLPVHAIDDDVVQRVRTMLAQLPSNRTKLYPKLTITAAIDRARSEGRPTLSSPTQAHYLDVFRDMLKVAVRKKYLSSNPAEGVRPLKKDGVPASEKRRPWTDQQVCDFFTGNFYRSCAPGAAEPYSKPDRDWRFWLPLVMLFSGARPNEICQLAAGDVRQTEAGVWFFSVSNEGEGNSLKTHASRRRVPIHPELIRIGFLAFAEARRKGGNGSRLFPGLKTNKYGNFAWYPTKRFNEVFLPAEISLDTRQSLYSLRHNVRDALRRAKAPAETLLAVTGWSPTGKAVSDNYGDPGNPDIHAEYVAKIAYPGLDLSFLHVGT